MSSPFTSYKGNSSFSRREEDELDKSSPSSPFDNKYSFTEKGKTELVIDHAIAGLQTCLHQYEEKARTCESQLEKLGVSLMDIPEDILSDLKEAFQDDDGVFDFPHASSEMVRINADHVLDSLQEKYKLGQLQMLSSRMETLVEENRQLENNLERKMNTEKEEAEKLEDKLCDKEANLVFFHEKLDTAIMELKNLQELSQGTQKPKYSLGELESLKQEVSKLKTDIAFINVKLKKYNNLPLNEKKAEKEKKKLKEDLKKVDNEMKMKMDM